MEIVLIIGAMKEFAETEVFKLFHVVQLLLEAPLAYLYINEQCKLLLRPGQVNPPLWHKNRFFSKRLCIGESDILLVSEKGGRSLANRTLWNDRCSSNPVVYIFLFSAS